jgi:hypothetical protein
LIIEFGIDPNAPEVPGEPGVYRAPSSAWSNGYTGGLAQQQSQLSSHFRRALELPAANEGGWKDTAASMIHPMRPFCDGLPNRKKQPTEPRSAIAVPREAKKHLTGIGL